MAELLATSYTVRHSLDDVARHMPTFWNILVAEGWFTELGREVGYPVKAQAMEVRNRTTLVARLKIAHLTLESTSRLHAKGAHTEVEVTNELKGFGAGIAASRLGDTQEKIEQRMRSDLLPRLEQYITEQKQLGQREVSGL